MDLVLDDAEDEVVLLRHDDLEQRAQLVHHAETLEGVALLRLRHDVPAADPPAGTVGDLEPDALAVDDDVTDDLLEQCLHDLHRFLHARGLN